MGILVILGCNYICVNFLKCINCIYFNDVPTYTILRCNQIVKKSINTYYIIILLNLIIFH